MASTVRNPRNLLKILALAASGAALAYLLIGEHRVHLLGWAPFLLLLLCPLLHLGMHGGHGGHGKGQEGPPGPSGDVPPHQHTS